jgi:hypothetical protein
MTIPACKIVLKPDLYNNVQSQHLRFIFRKGSLLQITPSKRHHVILDIFKQSTADVIILKDNSTAQVKIYKS